MLIEFIIKKNFYDDLEEKLYKQKNLNSIVYNFIPIIINNNYFIITCLSKLESYLLDYREDVKVKLYLKDEIKNINLKKIISFTEKNFNPREQYDCYIDSICNLLLIRFKSDELNYICIDDNLNIDTDILLNEQNLNLNYKWTDEFLNDIIYNKNNELIKYIWEEKYINLPQIPFIIDNIIIKDKLIPKTGSGVFTNNNLLGIVLYINNLEIIIAPLICIKKLSNYFYNNMISTLGLDLRPVIFNFESDFNKIEFENGLMICNNFYDNMKKNNLLKYDLTIDESFSNLYDILKKNNKFLKRKNIICSVDDYKINNIGNIIISECSVNKLNSKQIPFKSYIWLFKSVDDYIIKLKFIPNHIYNINLLVLNYKKIIISDSNLKKKIKINEKLFILEKNFNDISSFSCNEIKYITWKHKFMFELNEKILLILKNFIVDKSLLYKNIFTKIFKNRFTYNKKKIILIINFEHSNYPSIYILDKYIDFNDLIDNNTTNKHLKSFLSSI